MKGNICSHIMRFYFSFWVYLMMHLFDLVGDFHVVHIHLYRHACDQRQRKVNVLQKNLQAGLQLFGVILN